MGKWLRRIRGAIGMGFIWGVAWSAVGILPRFIFGREFDAPFPIIFGVLGFVAGLTFSVLLMLTEGRRRFDEMSLPRFAAWVPPAVSYCRRSSPGLHPSNGETY